MSPEEREIEMRREAEMVAPGLSRVVREAEACSHPMAAKHCAATCDAAKKLVAGTAVSAEKVMRVRRAAGVPPPQPLTLASFGQQQAIQWIQCAAIPNRHRSMA